METPVKGHILVIDDEVDILEVVSYNLRKDGHQITTAGNGENALRIARQTPPDLIILDLMLPGIDGLEVCRMMKNDARTSDIPIIMLTAKGEETDVVTGLELGADDYIIKPFSPKILSARVRALLRRKNSLSAIPENQTISIENLTIIPERFEVRVDDNVIKLTATEFRILHFLARHRGWVYTRMQIVDAARGDNHAVTDRSVDVHVVSLRKKLGDIGALVETVRGIGYRFKE